MNGAEKIFCVSFAIIGTALMVARMMRRNSINDTEDRRRLESQDEHPDAWEDLTRRRVS